MRVKKKKTFNYGKTKEKREIEKKERALLRDLVYAYKSSSPPSWPNPLSPLTPSIA